MSRRIHHILLICNSYDNYSLEEDGHIESQINLEYSELNLSNPPSITRADSTVEALTHLEAGERFDMIVTMYNVGRIDVFDFSARAKAICPDTPIVLLTSYSKEIYRQIELGDDSKIDFIFCWNNSTDLLIAIIKLFEDRMNAEHDILQDGVQAILLVEDSVRYYSTYLPALYKVVFQQNTAAIAEALNEQQRKQRKRARPKILFATNYEEAVSLYDKYRGNLLGVISDIGFVLHKGDSPTSEKLDAGVDLVHYIREDNPKLPILLQSSQESMREVADSLGVGFVVKNSKLLTAEISDFIAREFGFGDFVLRNPKTDLEIARIHNLYELEQMFKTIPDDILKHLAGTNLISKWLKARGLFGISKILAGMSVEKDGSIQAHRKALIDVVRDFRINQGLGVIAQYDPSTYNDAIWFARVGKGSMGGKARGLAFMNHILQKRNLYDKWEGVRVMVPRTLVITTEYFDRFIKDNGLKFVIMSDISDEDLLGEFVAATLPADLTVALRDFIKYVDKPLAIRSSSALEDSYYQPFAGVYSTYMIPGAQNEDQTLRLLSKAIKSVYASVYFASSRSYITASGNMISEEKMAIILQEVCGSEDGGVFLPTLSGVARSINFYPIGHETSADGVVKVAMGLGKAVVDGDQVLRFCPEYPRHVLQTSTPELTLTSTQQGVYALDLRADRFKTSIDDAVNFVKIPVDQCCNLRNIKYVASTYDVENQRIVDSAIPDGPKFITFSSMLKYNTFPISEIVKELIDVAKTEIKCDIEIEFAANLDVPDGSRAIFNVLQIRPISADTNLQEVLWDEIDCSNAIVYSSCALGTGWIKGVRDIVYIPEELWNTMETREMAEEITAINASMLKEKRQYVLIGYGRWGSSEPTLGVPVPWSAISEARAIVEASLGDFRVEPSQGTHFFQNLTSFNVGYINVNADSREGELLDTKALDAMPEYTHTRHFRHIRADNELTICIDGRGNRAPIKMQE